MLLFRAGFHASRRREVLKLVGHRQSSAPPRRLSTHASVLKRTSSPLVVEGRGGPDGGAHVVSQGGVGEGLLHGTTSWLVGHHTRLSSPLAISSATEESSPKNSRNNDPISLVEFVDALPPLLHLIKKNAAARRTSSLLHATTHDVEEARGSTSFDPVMDLFGRLDLTSRGIDDGESDSDGRYWWDRYAHPDPLKNYTRNLIATDHETYTLLLLCWNPGKSSPIHDHPCDGCWVRVCEGKIQETRYEVTENDETGTSTRLVMISDAVIEDSMPTFIHDSIGYHKVGNPSDAQVAVTLHLYCPPVKECKIWHDPADYSSRPSTAVMHNHTEYGIRINDP